MATEQSKAPKGGRKLRRCGKAALKLHFARNFGHAEANKKRRIAAHEVMIQESQERHGGTTASKRSYAVRHRARPA